MNSNKSTARLAGLMYLLLIITGIFNLMYVPSKLIVWDDPAATVDNIIASESLFRWGIVAGLMSYVFFLILPLVLYKLLAPINKTHAVLMVALAVVSVPISYFNILSKFDVLTLLSGADYLQGISKEELQTEVMLLLRSYNNGILMVQVFWALWLFPLGYLIFRSKFLPKLLGILLMLGCIGYLLDFFGRTLLPDYRDMAIASYITLPASIGEIGTCLWLLIMGAKNKPTV